MSFFRLCTWPGCRESTTKNFCAAHFGALPAHLRKAIASHAPQALEHAAEWIKTRKPTATTPAARPFNEPKEPDHE